MAKNFRSPLFLPHSV